MKNIFIVLGLLVSTFSFAQSRCCNVVDGSGRFVVSSDGKCVVAINSLSASNCGETVIEKVVEAPVVKEVPVVKEAPVVKEVPVVKQVVEEKKVEPAKVTLLDSEKAVLSQALEGVKFKTNSNELLPDSYPKLDAVAEIMKNHSDYKLTIDGYTDNRGDSKHNHELSFKRAEAAKARLIVDGISADRITTHGYGEEKPIATNDTPEGRAKNRRVEFLVSN